MDLRTVFGPNVSLMWAYQRWSAAEPDVTVTARVQATSAVAAVPPTLAHRVDSWEPSAVQDDWNAWSLRSTWTRAAADLANSQAPLTTKAQQFIVSPAAARLAAEPVEALTTALTAAVVPLLGLSSDEISGRLSDGASLTDLAVERGVRHGDLVNTVRAALPDLHDPILQTAAAEQVADTAGLIGPSGLFVAAVSGGDETQVLALSLDSTAGLLSLSAEELMDRLSGGASLNDLAAAAGIDNEALIDAVLTDLPPQLPGWSNAVALAEQLAADRTSTTETPAPAPPDPPAQQLFTLDPGTGPQTLALGLDSTAALLGVSTDALMARLSDGATLNDLADAAGVTHDDLIHAVLTDLPAELAGWGDVLDAAEQVSAWGYSFTDPPPAADGAAPTPHQFTLDSAAGAQTLSVRLDATATLLGSTAEALSQSLSEGMALNDLADAAGVAHEDLIDAILTDLPAQTPAWPDVTELAERIAGLAAVQDSPATDDGAQPQAVQAYNVDYGSGPQAVTLDPQGTSALLGVTPDDLMLRLSEGATLADLAETAGVAHQDLLDAIMGDLVTFPDGIWDLASLAEQVARSASSITESG